MAEEKEGILKWLSKPFVWVAQNIVSFGSWVISPIVKAFQGKEERSVAQHNQKNQGSSVIGTQEGVTPGTNTLLSTLTGAKGNLVGRGKKITSLYEKSEANLGASGVFEGVGAQLKEAEREKYDKKPLVRLSRALFGSSASDSSKTPEALTPEVRATQNTSEVTTTIPVEIRQSRRDVASEPDRQRVLQNPHLQGLTGAIVDSTNNVQKIEKIEAGAGELHQGAKNGRDNSRRIKDSVKAGNYLPDFFDFTKWGRSSTNPSVEAPRNTPTTSAAGKGTQPDRGSRGSWWGK